MTAESARVRPPSLRRPAYFELAAAVRSAGLYQRQPAYYGAMFVGLGIALAAGLVALFRVESMVAVVLISGYLGVVVVQVCFLAHDAGHRQVARTPFQNDMLVSLTTLVTGISLSWWIDSHEKHHRYPNDPRFDPNSRIPLVALTASAHAARSKVSRIIGTAQHWYFWIIIALEGANLHVQSLVFLRRNRFKGRYGYLDSVMMLSYFTALLALALFALSWPQAVAFLGTFHLVFGLYLGLAFTPNHIGMPEWPTDSRDVVRGQLLTTRNLRPGPVVDFVFGGLDYQIEHHLFPAIPRNKLPLARILIKEWCHANQLEYQESTVPKVYREIYQALRVRNLT